MSLTLDVGCLSISLVQNYIAITLQRELFRCPALEKSQAEAAYSLKAQCPFFGPLLEHFCIFWLCLLPCFGSCRRGILSSSTGWKMLRQRWTPSATTDTSTPPSDDQACLFVFSKMSQMRYFLIGMLSHFAWQYLGLAFCLAKPPCRTAEVIVCDVGRRRVLQVGVYIETLRDAMKCTLQAMREQKAKEAF